jgi:phosphoesterase RecJ-like protein
VKSSFLAIHQKLQQLDHILIVSHARPDADALGSTLGAALWLQQEGHRVTAWNEDGLPPKFSYLPESALITKPSDQVEEFDAILILDTATRARLGERVLAAARSPLWIAIDHHLSNDYFAHHNLINPSSPATGEILAEGFLQEKIAITPAIASNLYAAISTDTGSFQYSSTTERTFEIVAALVKAGVPVGELSQAMYGNRPRRCFDLLRHALIHTHFSCNDRIASFVLTRKDAAAFGTFPEDTEGIIDHLRSVEGVEVALFFEELEGSRVRISMRSKNLSLKSTDTANNFVAPVLAPSSTSCTLSRCAPSAPRSSLASAILKKGSKNLSLKSTDTANNFVAPVFPDVFDVSAFCQQYGGGGHRMAAGATLKGSLKEVQQRILTALCASLPFSTLNSESNSH